jgi:hypothetical protein
MGFSVKLMVYQGGWSIAGESMVLFQDGIEILIPPYIVVLWDALAKMPFSFHADFLCHFPGGRVF